MRPLAGKSALVTGAAGGIGRAIAMRLAEKGVRLALVDRDPFGLAATRRDAERVGVETLEYVCDVARREEVTNVTQEVIDRWAGVDLLVNNAGVTYHGPTHTMPAEEWDRLIAINLNSHVQFTCELLPSLLARPEAHVLNVCSVLGLSGMPRVAAYCTSKFAMVGFSESLRAEYGRVGLGVTALCPGFVRTGLFSAARPEREGGETKSPPAWLCVTPERVADRAVRAIERNEQRTVIDPRGRAIYAVKQFAPRFFDTILALGRSKRIARKERELIALSLDREQAIRLRLGLAEKGRGGEPAPTIKRKVA